MCEFTGTPLEGAPAAPKLPGKYEISALHLFKTLEKLEHRLGEGNRVSTHIWTSWDINVLIHKKSVLV